MFGELVPVGGGDPIPLLKKRLLYACGRTGKLSYEVTNQGHGWYYFHHHHMHISFSPPSAAMISG